MQRPNGFEEAKVQGEYELVEIGGHNMIVKQVTERKNKNGGDMIVVYFDFDVSDKQGGYFMKRYKDDNRQDKKWPNQATEYINVNTSEGKCSSKFKTFCTCMEHSNAGFKIFDANGNFNFDGCKNKKIGGVFGEQLDYYNGEEKKKRVLRWFISTDKVASADDPGLSTTKAYDDHVNSSVPSASAVGTPQFEEFMTVPDGSLDELPFN